MRTMTPRGPSATDRLYELVVYGKHGWLLTGIRRQIKLEVQRGGLRPETASCRLVGAVLAATGGTAKGRS